jgi:alkylhydroperoxidase/carboxymuconolactone decarboxylase family protein YurZ
VETDLLYVGSLTEQLNGVFSKIRRTSVALSKISMEMQLLEKELLRLVNIANVLRLGDSKSEIPGHLEEIKKMYALIEEKHNELYKELGTLMQL